MDGVTLIEEARLAGLTVSAKGELLKVRGPKRAERIAQNLLRHKPEVLAALEREAMAMTAPTELAEIVGHDQMGSLGSDMTATVPDHYIARNLARQQIIDLLLPVYRTDPERALALRDQWMDRLSIVAADPDCAEMAERVAFEEIRGELNMGGPESEVSK